MATQLFWKAFELNEKIYGRLLYPHIISMDVKSESFKIENSFSKLLPFYISSLNILLHLKFSAVLLIRFILIRNNHVPLENALLSLQFVSIFLVTTGLNYILHQDGKTLCIECLNLLYRYDRRLRNDRKPIGYTVNLIHSSVLYPEIRNFLRKSQSTDYLGIFMHGTICILLIAGAFIGLIGIFTNLDPGYVVFQNYPTTYATLFFRFILLQWAVVEVCRSLLVLFLPAISIFSIYCSCLHRIEKYIPNLETLKLYAQLHCINQIGMEPIRKVAALLMSVGFMLGVLGAWILLEGWKLFPKLVYVAMSLITVNIYIIIAETLPKIVRCQEFSKCLISLHWPRRAIWYVCGERSTPRSREYNIWKRMMTSQRAITFYYGPAAFDKDTKTNFYYNIFLNTVNVILVT